MRRTGEQQDKTLSLLKEGVESAKENSTLTKQVQALQQDMTLIRYALSNLMKVIPDINAMKSYLEDLDYRSIGILRATSECFAPVIDSTSFANLVETKAAEVRAETFDELSTADDAKNKLTVATGPIEENDTVIFTTDCATDPVASVFRTKVGMSSEEFKPHKEAFLGKQSGDSFPINIYGKEHVATVLGIRRTLNVESNPQ